MDFKSDPELCIRSFTIKITYDILFFLYSTEKFANCNKYLNFYSEIFTRKVDLLKYFFTPFAPEKNNTSQLSWSQIVKYFVN